MRRSVAFGSAIFLFALLHVVAGEGPPKAFPRKADIPYIRCALCEHLATHAWRSGRALLKTSTPSHKVDELQLLEHIEKVGTAWRSQGEWLARLDIERKGDGLTIVERPELGECGAACKTLEYAADQILGSYDTDIAETLYVGAMKRQEFTNHLCRTLARVCGVSPPPPLPATWASYPAWTPKDASAQDLDRVMGEMGDQGMRGKMYSREEIGAQLASMEEEEEEGKDEL